MSNVDPKSQLKGMINIHRSLGVTLTNMTFSENWLFESFFSRRERALLLYLQDFNGTITLNGARISNHTGMYTKEVRDRFMLNLAVSQSIKVADGKLLLKPHQFFIRR